MAKHIVIFFASTYRKDATVSKYTDTTGRFAAECEQTNETALKYIKWKLAQQQEEITVAYAFTTKAVQEQDFRRLRIRFLDEPYVIRPICFDEQSTIEGSFNSINIMFDVLQQAYAADEDVTIHMDLTGGLRHSTVLMLALLQLLQYAGYHLGLVTYTNFNEKRIETVNELVGMFNLISGTADFTHNGSVQQLQQFFATAAPSIQLQSLLAKMAYFSECIKSCSHRGTLLEAAQSLRRSLEVYKNSLAAMGSAVGEQESFFARLLPLIERDYADIFACDTSVKTIPTLLNWCLRKGLLQQAATYATELLPVYLVDSGLVRIHKQEIIDECRSSSQMWSNWQVYFLKNYQYKEATAVSIESNDNVVFDYNRLRVLVDREPTANEMLKIIGTQNLQLTKFLQEVLQLTMLCQNSAAALEHKINMLPADNMLRIVVEAGKPTTCSLLNFLEKRLNVLYSLDRVIISCIKQASKKIISELFAFNDFPSVKDKEEKSLGRADYLLYLRSKGLISSSLDDDTLREVVINYLDIVAYRNTISHADGKTQDKTGKRASLAELITRELELIQSAK